MVAYATTKALEAQISPSTVLYVLKCESSLNPEAVGDGGHSHGLAQIYMPVWGEEISIEQATDPQFAIDFMVEKMADGQGNLWTCFRNM